MAQTRRSPEAPPERLNCRSCPTLGSAQWRTLGEDEVALLDREKSTHAYAQGDELFAHNSPCTHLHCIAAGSVVLRKVDRNGLSILVRLVEAGRTVGYRSHFNGGWHAERAEVLEPSTICHVPGETLARLLASNPRLGEQFSISLAEDLSEVENALLAQVARPVRARVAHLLYTLIERFGDGDENGRIVLRVPFGHQTMAELLGVHRETVTRCLSALEADGVVAHDARNLTIPDLDRLLDEFGAD